MADKEHTKCAHTGCNCMAADDSKYCSPYCENAGDADLTEIACGCEHAGCS